MENLINHIRKHIELSKQEELTLSGYFSSRRLLKRAFLFQQGSVCKYETFINKGCLRSFYVDQYGVEHTLHFAKEGYWISDLESFLFDTPAATYASALETAEVFQIDRNSLEKLYQEIPAFETFSRILHQRAYIAQNKRILNNISMNGAERYLNFVEEFPDMANRIPQKYLASYLGMTPVFLSQIRKQYAQGKLK